MENILISRNVSNLKSFHAEVHKVNKQKYLLSLF